MIYNIYIFKNVASWKIPEQAMEVYSCKIIKLNGGLLDILVALNFKSVSGKLINNCCAMEPKNGFWKMVF